MRTITNIYPTQFDDTIDPAHKQAHCSALTGGVMSVASGSAVTPDIPLPTNAFTLDTGRAVTILDTPYKQ